MIQFDVWNHFNDVPFVHPAVAFITAAVQSSHELNEETIVAFLDQVNHPIHDHSLHKVAVMSNSFFIFHDNKSHYVCDLM